MEYLCKPANFGPNAGFILLCLEEWQSALWAGRYIGPSNGHQVQTLKPLFWQVYRWGMVLGHGGGRFSRGGHLGKFLFCRCMHGV